MAVKCARKMQLNIYVEPELYAWLSEQAEKRGEGLSPYIVGLLTGVQRRMENPEESIHQQLATYLDRIHARISHIIEAQRFFEEFIAAFIRVYMNHTPAIPDHKLTEMGKSGGERFEKLLKFVVDNYKGPKSLLYAAKSRAEKQTDHDAHAQP